MNLNLIFKTNKMTSLSRGAAGEHNGVEEEESRSSFINLKHLYFSEPIQNSIIHDSFFIRINYSDNDVSLVGLILPVKLSFVTISKSFNKNIITYDMYSNKETISNICHLETSILEKYNHFLNSTSKSNTLKTPIYNLSNQLKSCSIKLFSDTTKNTQECNIMLKISGIWENVKEYGITFKFTDVQ